MYKNKKIPIIFTAVTVLVVGIIGTIEYTNIRKNLEQKTEKVKKLENNILNQKKEIERLNRDLETSNEDYNKLLDSNKKLESQVETLQKELKEKVFPTQSISKKTIGVGTPVKITMTFYGDFAHENGGYAGIDCNGDKLVLGTVASNYYPQGTQFEFNGQVFTVRDRGGSNFNSPNRLDVFVPRLKNESNRDYSNRIKEYGRRTVTMYKR